jgi:CHAT domain-containing protein
MSARAPGPSGCGEWTAWEDHPQVAPSRWAALSAFGTCGVLLWAPASGCRPPETGCTAGLARTCILAALGPVRPVAARLCGLSYAAEQSRFAGDPRRLARLAAHLETDAGAPALAALALVDLAGSHLDRAIARLEQARGLAPFDAEIASDLAAARLERGAGGNVPDLLLALDAAGAAVALAPRLPEARFNLALALERSGLGDGARRAWKEVQILESDSPWAAEAARHLRQGPGQAEAAPRSRRGGEFAGALTSDDPADAGLAATAALDAVRRHVERELLRHWAQSVRARDAAAAATLRLARRWAEAFAARTNDRLIADAVAAIERTASGSARQAALAEGHLAFARAAHELESYGDARQIAAGFYRAAKALRRGGSPFRWSAELLAATAEFRLSRYQAALRLLRRIDTEAGGRYPSLHGQIRRLEGLIQAVTAQPVAAIRSYLDAIASFHRTGETEREIDAEELLAESQAFLGNFATAWSHLFRALDQQGSLQAPRLRAQILHGAARLALDTGARYAALRLESGALEAARDMAAPVAVAETLAARAAIWSDLGRPDEAVRDLTAAQRSAALTDDASLQLDLRLAEARVLGTARRADAVAALDAALPLLQRTRYTLQLATFFLERGKLERAAGKTMRAVEDLDAGIRQLEKLTGTMAPAAGETFIERSYELYTERVRLTADHDAAPFAATFRQLERSRYRALAAWRGPAGKPPAVLDLAAAEHAMTAGDVLVEYAALPNELLAWVVEPARARCVSIPVTDQRLRELAEALVQALAARRDAREASRALFRGVIAPLGLPPGAARLLVAPDGALFQIPFAALLDPVTDRYLVEDHAIELVPGASAYFEALPEQARRGARPHGVLVVGDPAVDPALERRRLPEALAEAADVAALYPGSRTITGREATRPALLAALPGRAIVHLAVHAEVDRRSPLLSRLYLAPSPGDSGILFAHELYGLRCPATRLVFLSGCGTAAGALSPSEGVMSLARPFLAGGAQAVVGSLWPVDDTAAHAFSLAFHRRYRATRDAAAALAAAQVALLHGGDPGLRSPASWGAFTLVGLANARPPGGN